MAVNKFSLWCTRLHNKLSEEEKIILLKWEAIIDEGLSDSCPEYCFDFMDFKVEVEGELNSDILRILKLMYHHNNGWRMHVFYKQIPAPWTGFKDGPVTSIRIYG